MMQVSRLLKPAGGRLISIPFAQPHFRVPLYVGPAEDFDWDVEIGSFGTGFQYFIYTMTRGQPMSNYCRGLREQYEHRKHRRDTDTVVHLSDSEDENYLLDAVNID